MLLHARMAGAARKAVDELGAAAATVRVLAQVAWAEREVAGAVVVTLGLGAVPRRADVRQALAGICA